MIGTMRGVVFDAPDHHALASYYQQLFDGELAYSDDEFDLVQTPDGWRLGFQPAPGHVPPRWPDPSAPQQIHLDLQVPDIEAAAQRAERLGATRIGGGDSWHVLADPAGHPFCVCANEQTEPIRLFAVNLDCADPRPLAAFYAALFGLDVKHLADDGAWIGNDEAGMGEILFQRVDGYQPPRWPDPAHPQQLHLEATVADIDQAEAGALELGARPLPGDGGNWRVYADPAGHPFCLVF